MLEPFPIRLNRIGALVFCFYAFSLREPISTSLENAVANAAIRNQRLTAARKKPGKVDATFAAGCDDDEDS
jgi:hypothetical protein